MGNESSSHSETTMKCGHCIVVEAVPGCICWTCDSSVCYPCSKNCQGEKCPQLDPKWHELGKRIKVVDRDKSPERPVDKNTPNKLLYNAATDLTTGIKRMNKKDKYKTKLKEIKEKRKENELLWFFKSILDDIHVYDYFSYCSNCDYPNVNDLIECENCELEYCDECIVWHSKLDALDKK